MNVDDGARIARIVEHRTGAEHEAILSIRAGQARVLQSVLWSLLGFVLLAILLSATAAVPAPFTVATNVAMAVPLVASLWLNRRGSFTTAVNLVIVTLLVAATISPLVPNVEGAVSNLQLFFVPVVLAGLLLGRMPLTLATAWAAIAALLITWTASRANLFAGIQFVVVLAVVALFLDGFGWSLRRALANAASREAELASVADRHERTAIRLQDETRFRSAIIDSLPGMFYVVDENGRYVDWNDKLLSNSGYTEEELKELNALDGFAEEDREQVAVAIGRTFQEGTAQLEIPIRRKDGTLVRYFLTGRSFTMSGHNYLVGIGIDRSEIDSAESRISKLNDELRERLERITALHEIDRAITELDDEEAALQVVLRQVTDRLRIDAARILVYQPGSQRLYCEAGRGIGHRGGERTLRLGEGIAGQAALHHRDIVIDGKEEVSRGVHECDRAGFPELGFYAAIPLLAKGRLHGVLELLHRSELHPNDDWLSYLRTLATQAAIALDSARLLEDLERSNLELRLAYDTTIEGWARALDLRDEETEGHSRRVTETTLQLAGRFGVAEDELVHIRRGALLHDIGKMGVPDRILLKPGRLDPEERQVMEHHAAFAYKLLSPIGFLRPAIDIPYCHHERWDGSGYPRGLRGEQIPFPARIFAVVDVFDALTSNRPYRSAWSVERALDYIEGERARQFDPAITDEFLAMIGNQQVVGSD